MVGILSINNGMWTVPNRILDATCTCLLSLCSDIGLSETIDHIQISFSVRSALKLDVDFVTFV